MGYQAGGVQPIWFKTRPNPLLSSIVVVEKPVKTKAELKSGFLIIQQAAFYS